MRTTHRRSGPATVCRVAEELMAEHGRTTTLAVKNQLQAHGYWAVQAEVSFLMALLARDRGWTVVCDARHRTYLPSPVVTWGAEAGWYPIHPN
jgi:hypothetical protein